MLSVFFVFPIGRIGSDSPNRPPNRPPAIISNHKQIIYPILFTMFLWSRVDVIPSRRRFDPRDFWKLDKHKIELRLTKNSNYDFCSIRRILWLDPIWFILNPALIFAEFKPFMIVDQIQFDLNSTFVKIPNMIAVSYAGRFQILFLRPIQLPMN